MSSTDGIQILVDRRVPPSPGDGVVFATVAYRLVSCHVDGHWETLTGWCRWRGAYVKRSNEPTQQLLFVDDVQAEAHNFHGVPGAASAYLDPASLDVAISDGANDDAPDPLFLTGILVAESDLVRPIPSAEWRAAVDRRLAILEARASIGGQVWYAAPPTVTTTGPLTTPTPYTPDTEDDNA